MRHSFGSLGCFAEIAPRSAGLIPKANLRDFHVTNCVDIYGTYPVNIYVPLMLHI